MGSLRWRRSLRRKGSRYANGSSSNLVVTPRCLDSGDERSPSADEAPKDVVSFSPQPPLLETAESSHNPSGQQASADTTANDNDNTTTARPRRAFTPTPTTTNNDNSNGTSSSSNKTGIPGFPTSMSSPSLSLNTEGLNASAGGASGSTLLVGNDLLNFVFGPPWDQKKADIKARSQFGHRTGWNVYGMIVKVDDDLRQENLAFQLVSHFQRIFSHAALPLRLVPYRVLAVGPDRGLVELIPDAVSLDSLKKKVPGVSLAELFERAYGARTELPFRRAQRNFVESLAAYCIVCYLLNIKDRHNGNIMLTRSGQIVHIDFGFMLGNAPGTGKLLTPSGGWESAPFKLTSEFIDIMGGQQSEVFQDFTELCIEGFLCARKNMSQLIVLIRCMMREGSPSLPCFEGGRSVVSALERRFHKNLNRAQTVTLVKGLISQSIDAWSTTAYDRFQQITNNIRK